MSQNIWIVSDTHFNHKNLVDPKNSSKFKEPLRPEFSSVEEMNEVLINNWNSVVKQGDKIYHLGDVAFDNNKMDWMNKNWNRLNGNKTLILGNHDDVKKISRGQYFKYIRIWKSMTELGLIFTHVPLNIDCFRSRDSRHGKDAVNVHGHLHCYESPQGPFINVSVEQTNYCPVNLDTILLVARGLR